MQKYEVVDKLNELKDYAKIRIVTMDKKTFDVNYFDIINNTEKEYLYIKALSKENEKMFLYCSICNIFPV